MAKGTVKNTEVNVVKIASSEKKKIATIIRACTTLMDAAAEMGDFVAVNQIATIKSRYDLKYVNSIMPDTPALG